MTDGSSLTDIDLITLNPPVFYGTGGFLFAQEAAPEGMVCLSEMACFSEIVFFSGMIRVRV